MECARQQESHAPEGHMPADQHPRRRLEEYGAEALRDAELLAIILGGDQPAEDALRMGERLLSAFGGLAEISRAGFEELSDAPGMSPDKAAVLLSTAELGRRLTTARREERIQIQHPTDVVDLLLMPRYRAYDTERMLAIMLDIRNRVLRVVEVTRGGLDSAEASPRDIFRAACKHSAAQVILAHNHPSGDPEPSASDIAVTRRIVEAGKTLGIPVLDHIILGDGAWVSLKQRGVM
ncbi:MAG TPA: DNA repair protein RadC [Candidatus Hydrogenedentes bacterium]|nr:DNA repair protein RadC [Candidatus Hydrogenedentota bacterium]